MLNNLSEENLEERNILDNETTMLYAIKKNPTDRLLFLRKSDKKFITTPKPDAKRKLANK